MACRDVYKKRKINKTVEIYRPLIAMPAVEENVYRLLFGVDSIARADAILQNNINMFEWVLRNKIYPNFWGRNINGENAIDREEIEYLHGQGCKIAPIYVFDGVKETEDEGRNTAKKAVALATALKIPEATAIFLEIKEASEATTAYMRGFADEVIMGGYTPAFKANTDAKYNFDREFSRGMQTNREIFNKCLVWATAPSLAEYDRITTTHLIHPDNWTPFAPSGLRRNEIAVWQYGKECHPIEDNRGNQIFFNLNLVRNEEVIIEKMF